LRREMTDWLTFLAWARAATPAGGRGPLIVVLGDAEGGEGASSGMELEADGTLV